MYDSGCTFFVVAPKEASLAELQRQTRHPGQVILQPASPLRAQVKIQG